MRFLKRLAIGVVLLVGAAAVVVWFQPDDYRLTRATVIAAPAADVFARVNDLRKWDDWSPWAKLDPNAKVTFSGPQSGSGRDVRVGRQRQGRRRHDDDHREQAERARRDAHGFPQPFAGTSNSDFIFWQQGNQPNARRK